MIDRRPALIARCTGTADVVQAVRFAREHRLLRVGARRRPQHRRAGGVRGRPDDRPVADARRLGGSGAARTARAQAGCTLGDVDRETQLHGLAAVLGFVSATGIAGLTVGGGFGYLTRRYGWTCDNAGLDGGGDRRRQGRARVRRRERRSCSGRCAAAAATSASSRRSSTSCSRSGPRSSAARSRGAARTPAQVLDSTASSAPQAPRELTCVAVLRIAPPAPWLPKEIHGKPIVAMFVCHSGHDRGGRRAGRAAAQARQAGGRHRHAPALRADAEPARRDPAQGPALLLEVGVPARASIREPIDIAVEHAARIPSPHSAIILFQIGAR